MREAVIVSTARTPIGKAYRGGFNNLAAPTLAGHAISAAVQRAGLRVRESQNFHDFAYAARVPTSGLTEDEWACSRLYRTLVVEHRA